VVFDTGGTTGDVRTRIRDGESKLISSWALSDASSRITKSKLTSISTGPSCIGTNFQPRTLVRAICTNKGWPLAIRAFVAAPRSFHAEMNLNFARGTCLTSKRRIVNRLVLDHLELWKALEQSIRAKCRPQNWLSALIQTRLPLAIRPTVSETPPKVQVHIQTVPFSRAP